MAKADMQANRKPKSLSFWLFVCLLAGFLVLEAYLSGLIAIPGSLAKPPTSDASRQTHDSPVVRPNLAAASMARLAKEVAQPAGAQSGSVAETQKLSAAWATQLFAKGDFHQSISVAKYVIETRLGDDYWVEAIPALTASSLQLDQGKDLVAFAVGQINRSAMDYPEENERIQVSISGGFLESMLKANRPDVALELAAAIRAGEASDAVKEVAAAFAERIKQHGKKE